MSKMETRTGSCKSVANSNISSSPWPGTGITFTGQTGQALPSKLAEATKYLQGAPAWACLLYTSDAADDM
eukprot:7869536-Alexandrium_andersonii.AAC.1